MTHERMMFIASQQRKWAREMERADRERRELNRIMSLRYSNGYRKPCTTDEIKAKLCQHLGVKECNLKGELESWGFHDSFLFD